MDRALTDKVMAAFELNGTGRLSDAALARACAILDGYDRGRVSYALDAITRGHKGRVTIQAIISAMPKRELPCSSSVIR